MDFFHAQEKARKNVALLLGLFILAVMLIVVLTEIILLVAIYYSAAPGPALMENDPFNVGWPVMAGVAAVIVGIIGIGSAAKMRQLSRGGGALVAESMGGKWLSPGRARGKEAVLVHVVEEMAIASGTPVPEIYVIEGTGINAFAAGYDTDDAVIGVTRGCIEQLNRSELQGVVAHEFSHILNGDMRTNIRVAGLLHGIVMISMAGYFLFRGQFRRVRSGRAHRNAGILSAGYLGMLAGAGLIAVGFVGSFFGSLIKSLVSREHEYRADASAVQFTRNSDGIVGALIKILQSETGSAVSQVSASEFSHAFFANAFNSLLFGLFPTHPPLVERIRRIKPNWEGVQTVRSVTAQRDAAPDSQNQVSPAGTSMLARVGNLNRENVDHARAIIRAVPKDVRRLCHDDLGARCVVYATLLSVNETIRQLQWHHLRRQCDPALTEKLQKLLNTVLSLSPDQRLALVEMALPSLRQLGLEAYETFKEVVNALIAADNRIDLFEWALRKYVFKTLDRNLYRVTRYHRRSRSLSRLKDNCTWLLSCLSHAGHGDQIRATSAFLAGYRSLGFQTCTMMPKNKITISGLDEAVEILNTLPLNDKRKLLQACITTANYDRRITANETTMLRAVGALLDCPIPPLDDESYKAQAHKR